MKVGIRKPSLKKSIKARTTGKLKRTIKKSVNPLYGKKGMGYINDPKKAIYNKVYNKTTVGVNDIVKIPTHKSHNNTDHNITTNSTSIITYKIIGILSLILGIIFSLLGLLSLSVGGLFLLIGGLILILLSLFCLKIYKIKKEVEE